MVGQIWNSDFNVRLQHSGRQYKTIERGQKLFYDVLNLCWSKECNCVSHKGGHVFPNAHHPAEAKSFYAELEQLIPQSSIQLYEVSGHNHNSASAEAKGWYISGTGGRSFYQCGLDTDWTFCNNKTVAYLQATIPDSNMIAFNFIDTAGKTLH